MYADQVTSTDLLCERVAMMAHVATVMGVVRDDATRAKLAQAMDIILKSVSPATNPAIVVTNVVNMSGSMRKT